VRGHGAARLPLESALSFPALLEALGAAASLQGAFMVIIAGDAPQKGDGVVAGGANAGRPASIGLAGGAVRAPDPPAAPPRQRPRFLPVRHCLALAHKRWRAAQREWLQLSLQVALPTLNGGLMDGARPTLCMCSRAP